METVVIREATLEDLPSIRRICWATCTDEHLLKNPKTLYLIFADYYLNEEQGHNFVAVANGEVVGYILSSWDRKAFLKAMKENYLPVLKQSDPKFYRLRASYLRASYFWRHYPAHLHINIFPEYQHQGIGMRLMRNLLVKMRLNHIPSVALTVAKSHPGAIAFYKKNGFQVILRWFGALVLGRKL
jgi:ribosomal protein S18 acetylase RimI-like enzyme